MDEDKVYVRPEHIHLSTKGIFVLTDTGRMHIEQLNCDENGIYYVVNKIDKITDKCPNGHKIWCLRCGGCVTRWCKFRCKCVEWE